jgi:hypothetical protein
MLSSDPRRVLDNICDIVGRASFPCMVGWSIGTRKVVIAEIATRLEEPPRMVDLQLEMLIDWGWLHASPKIAESSLAPDDVHLGISHQGWKSWSYFDETDCSIWTNDFEDWLKWDGDVNEPPKPTYQEAFVEKPRMPQAQSSWHSIDEP